MVARMEYLEKLKMRIPINKKPSPMSDGMGVFVGPRARMVVNISGMDYHCDDKWMPE